jgi:hypothetical protein
VAAIPDDGAGMTTRPSVDRSLGLRLLAVSAISAVSAIVPALLVGFATYEIVMSGASESDTWAELGAAIFGAVLGLLAGVIGYVLAVVIGVRRVVPAGLRLRPTIAVLVLPVGLSLPGAIAGATAGRRSPELLVAGASLLLLAAVIAGLAALAGVVDVRLGALLAGPVATVAIGLLVTAALVADAAERDDKLEAIERMGTLPLVDGTRLDEPFPGWTLDAVRHRSYDDSIDVHWDVEGDEPGDAHLTITSTDIEIRVHAGDDWQALEDQLRSRLVRVPAERFIEACGRRC